jgi:multiple sugar transport system substrate-binding protein
MKKALWLSLALGGFIAAGAVQAGYSGPKVSLSYFHGFLGPDRPYMENLVKKFNETHPNIEVRYQGQDWGTTAQQLLPLVSAGKAPDVVAWLSWDIAQFISKGAMSEITPTELQAAGVSKSNYYAKVFQGAVYRGKTYGAPMHLVTVATYYNKALMRKMGVTTVPRTRQQFIDTARKCTVDRGGKRPGETGFEPNNLENWGAGIPLGAGTFRMGITVIEQNGVDFLDKDGNAAYATPEAAEALQFLKDATDKYNVGPANATEDSEAAAFRQGKTCFNFAGAWMLGQYSAQLGKNLGVAAFPRLGTQRDAGFGDASFLTLPKQAADYDPNKRAAAVEFVGWMTGAAQNLEFTKSGSLPTQPAVAANADYKSNPMYGAFQGFKNVSIYGGLGGSTKIPFVLGPLGNAIEGFMTGKEKDALKALEVAETDSNKLIDQAR